MKKLFFLVCACLFMAACSSEDSPITEEPLTKMDAIPGWCTYPVGNASDASASYTVEMKQNPHSGVMEKIMTFNATLSGTRDPHHTGTFRVFFYKDAALKESVLTDGFISNTLTLEINVGDYKESKLYVLFNAPGSCSDDGTGKHGFVGEANFDPYSNNASETFTFKVVNGLSAGACSYDIGQATANYTVAMKQNPYTGVMEKTMTFQATLSGQSDPHHAGAFRVFFYSDPELKNSLSWDGFINNGTVTMEMNVDNYRESAIYVTMRPPSECSSGYRTDHYFLGEAYFYPYEDNFSQTFNIVTVNK